MTKELNDQLYEKYPDLLEGYKKSPRESCLAFGCEHGDGWYWLIDNLLEFIKASKQEVKVDQIKEKFGGLRFYYSGGDLRIDGAVSLAEIMSYNICENCGSTDDVSQTTGWIKSLCKKCIK